VDQEHAVCVLSIPEDQQSGSPDGNSITDCSLVTSDQTLSSDEEGVGSRLRSTNDNVELFEDKPKDLVRTTEIDILIHMGSVKVTTHAVRRLSEKNIKSSLRMYGLDEYVQIISSASAHCHFPTKPLEPYLRLHPLPMSWCASVLQALCRSLLIRKSDKLVADHTEAISSEENCELQTNGIDQEEVCDMNQPFVASAASLMLPDMLKSEGSPGYKLQQHAKIASYEDHRQDEEEDKTKEKRMCKDKWEEKVFKNTANEVQPENAKQWLASPSALKQECAVGGQAGRPTKGPFGGIVYALAKKFKKQKRADGGEATVIQTEGMSTSDAALEPAPLKHVSDPEEEVQAESGEKFEVGLAPGLLESCRPNYKEPTPRLKEEHDHVQMGSRIPRRRQKGNQGSSKAIGKQSFLRRYSTFESLNSVEASANASENALDHDSNSTSVSNCSNPSTASSTASGEADDTDLDVLGELSPGRAEGAPIQDAIPTEDSAGTGDDVMFMPLHEESLADLRRLHGKTYGVVRQGDSKTISLSANFIRSDPCLPSNAEEPSCSKGSRTGIMATSKHDLEERLYSSSSKQHIRTLHSHSAGKMAAWVSEDYGKSLDEQVARRLEAQASAKGGTASLRAASMRRIANYQHDTA